MSKQRINRAIHWDGRGGQAWHEGVTHHLRMPPRINGKPVQRISYYPLSMVKAGRTILEAGETVERDLTVQEQAELDVRLDVMSKVGLAVWE